MMLKRWISFSAIIMGLFPCKAQDGHYWTQQYGTKSMLLSNSVIGGVEDLGAVYYNPGRLAVIPNSAFLLSGNVYEYNGIDISNAAGTSKSVSTSSIKGVPSLVAGTFKIKLFPKHYFAYAVLTRQQGDLSFSYQEEVHKDVISSLPGDEYFGGEITATQKSQEQWIGLTWSYAPIPKLSVGVTTNFSANNEARGSSINLQALSQNNGVALYRYDREISYKQNGLLWKVGLASTLGKWQLGLTATTPIVELSGKGTYRYEEFFSAIPGMTQTERYSSSYQKGLATHYKTPWSVGAGVTRPMGRNKIHVSTEWYGGTPKYSVMQAASHITQSNPTDTVHFNLVDKSKSVWNVGVGTEIYLSEHVSGFASFSTDFTSVESDITRFIERKAEANNSSWNADFYHIGGGVVVNLKRAAITLGATHTGANLLLPAPVNFPENSSQGIFSGTNQADLRWDRWRLVFSFSIPFLRDYTDKILEEKK